MLCIENFTCACMRGFHWREKQLPLISLNHVTQVSKIINIKSESSKEA